MTEKNNYKKQPSETTFEDTKKIEKSFFEIINNVSKFIVDTNAESAEIIGLYQDMKSILEHRKLHYTNIRNLLESISASKTYIDCVEFTILDYDYLVDYISNKSEEDQTMIVEILTEYLSQFFIWKTNHYHCLVELYIIDTSNQKMMEQ